MIRFINPFLANSAERNPSTAAIPIGLVDAAIDLPLIPAHVEEFLSYSIGLVSAMVLIELLLPLPHSAFLPLAFSTINSLLRMLLFDSITTIPPRTGKILPVSFDF